MLAEHLPLEQGLRHLISSEDLQVNLFLAEHLPLEQGLRHAPDASYRTSDRSRRASSIRTRIKTHLQECLSSLVIPLAEHLPLEQGLRLVHLLIVEDK